MIQIKNLTLTHMKDLRSILDDFSPLSGPVIRERIREFPGTVISISHDRKYIEETADVVYELTAGGLTEK